MRTIFSRLLDELNEGRSAMLVIIVADNGSAPRGTGAGMLVGENGRIVGTIGGGAVEYQAEKMALDLLRRRESALHEFTLRPNSREDIGMQCGGDVTVLFSCADADDMRWSLLAGAVCDRIESRAPGWLIHPLDGSIPSLYGPDGLLSGAAVAPETASVLCRRRSITADGCFAEPLPVYNRVVIFGGGHIAQALTPLLSAVDFRSVVLDSRPEYAELPLFPGAEEAICCDYEKISDYVNLTSEDYVIVMTNGHSHDLVVEEQVLRSSYAYLGVIGSRSKIAVVNETLISHGIDPELLKTVHTPIGLSIKAVTPAEIAVSILGELILCRAELRDGSAEVHHGCPMQ